jgi:hypothetical protein
MLFHERFSLNRYTAKWYIKCMRILPMVLIGFLLAGAIVVEARMPQVCDYAAIITGFINNARTTHLSRNLRSDAAFLSMIQFAVCPTDLILALRFFPATVRIIEL